MNCFGGILAPLPWILISICRQGFGISQPSPACTSGPRACQARLEDAAPAAGHHCATPEAAIAFAAVIKDCRASTLHENIVRLGFELIGPIRAGIPIPRTPPPGSKEPTS